jgi:hypothetical protein
MVKQGHFARKPIDPKAQEQNNKSNSTEIQQQQQPPSTPQKQ